MSLINAIQQVRDAKWCCKWGCTTCGAWQMRQTLLGIPVTPRPQRTELSQLTFERAVELCQKLSEITYLTLQDAPAVRFFLIAIDRVFGARAYEKIFPILEGSIAGCILQDAQIHYAERLKAQREHQLRQGVKTGPQI